MRPPTVVLAIAALVLLVHPASAQTKTYNFSWYTECQNRNGTSANQAAAGLATLTPASSGGYQLRFSGPGNTTGSADVPPPDASGQSSVQNLSVPNACGFTLAAPTPFGLLSGAFADPTAFWFDSLFQGGGDRLLALGAAAKTIVVPTITSPDNGATVTGATTVTTSVGGVSAGISLTYHLLVDGTEVGAAASMTLEASVFWDSATVGDGEHTLQVLVADSFGTVLGSNVVIVTVANGG
jgi:hypothetical protein